MQLIKLTFDAAQVPVAEDADAIAEQQTALAELSEVTQVTNSGEQDKAVRRARKAKILVQEAEKSRRAILKPIELLTDRINTIAKGYKSKLELEINRVNMMCSQFQAQEDERLAAIERKRQEDIARAEAERVAQERRAKEAADAAARAAAEAAAAAPDDRDAQAMAELREQEAKDAAAAEARAAEVARAKADEAILKPEAERERASGQIVREVVKYEVTDIVALYGAAPHLVRLEPNLAAIREVLSKDLKLPGLKVWTERTSSVRA